MKSEPDCYSLSDLERDGKDPWSGVRNYQARKYMRDLMSPGDQVLYYHSSTAVPGVVGLAQIMSKPYSDPTQFDEKSEYFDPKSNPEKPTWILVDVGFKEHFKRIIPLDEIKASSTLSSMVVAQRGSRLSITPVEEHHFIELCKLGRNG